jgi:hypothetical protein
MEAVRFVAPQPVPIQPSTMDGLAVTTEFDSSAGDHLALLGFLRQCNPHMDVLHVLAVATCELDGVAGGASLRC